VQVAGMTNYKLRCEEKDMLDDNKEDEKNKIIINSFYSGPICH
jgi:hypothetical protein